MHLIVLTHRVGGPYTEVKTLMSIPEGLDSTYKHRAYRLKSSMKHHRSMLKLESKCTFNTSNTLAIDFVVFH
jgi:hypothetical protein